MQNLTSERPLQYEYWTLPKVPFKVKLWQRIPKVSKNIPFGYEIDPEDEDWLNPIPEQLELLELAKKHVKQYSLRQVAAWLTTQSGRKISHVGLIKRIKIEQKRKSQASTQRYLAERYKEALQKAEKLETKIAGAT